MKVHEWHGVFSPGGYLEAVEESPEMAKAAAENLSPSKGPGNRMIRPVIIVEGDLGAIVGQALVVASANVSAAQRAKLTKAIEAGLDFKALFPIEQRARAAEGFAQALDDLP